MAKIKALDRKAFDTRMTVSRLIKHMTRDMKFYLSKDHVNTEDDFKNALYLCDPGLEYTVRRNLVNAGYVFGHPEMSQAKNEKN